MFIHSSVTGHLNYFHVWLLEIKLLLNSWASLCIDRCFHPSGSISRKDAARSKCVYLYKKLSTFFLRVCNTWEFQLPYVFSNAVSLFKVIHPNVCIALLHCGFMVLFLNFYINSSWLTFGVLWVLGVEVSDSSLTHGTQCSS